MLHSIAEVHDKIAAGASLLLAGSEEALSQLPRGNWIGGTIPYFMERNGGVCSESQVFVTEIPQEAVKAHAREYTLQDLPSICKDAPENGFSFIIIPAGCSVHSAYAEDAPSYEGMFSKPVVGWVSGVHISQVDKRRPKVFLGPVGKTLSESAVVMHVALPRCKFAQLDIINVFEPGAGDVITFPASGFSACRGSVNGKPANFAHYISDLRHDLRIPLTADYNGSFVNVSLQSVDAANGIVKFYAPVFSGVEYTLAKPIADYVAAFESTVRNHPVEPVFSCNCVLNYLHAGLEGRRTGKLTGPVTFGEIAHQLLNQTIVSLLIRDVCQEERRAEH